MDFIVNYWIQFIFGLIITFGTYLFHKLTNYYKNISSSVDSVKVLLKAKIVEEYHMIKREKTISIYQKQLILDLWREYKNLGGNGFVDEMIEEIERIPISEC